MANKTNKPRARARQSKKTTQDAAGSRIDRLVELQRAGVKRYAQLASSAANRISQGDFNPAGWVADYSSVWSASAGDLDEILKSTVGDTKARAAKRTAQKPEEHRPDGYLNWLALQRSFLARIAGYYREVGELVGKGSMEPREWIEGGANFWGDVIADMGDWLRRESGEQLRPTTEWLPRLRKEIKPGRPTSFVGIEVPTECFPDQDGADPEITLLIDGLSRVGGGAALEPVQNLKFAPATVKRSSPHSELRLFDLPASLRPGDVYATLVWAKWADGTTKGPIAAIEIAIV